MAAKSRQEPRSKVEVERQFWMRPAEGVGMDQEAKINESVAAIKSLVGRLPDESREVISEKWGREMVQDDDCPVFMGTRYSAYKS